MIDSNKPLTIFLDMDGVIANFIKGVSFIFADEDLHKIWREQMKAKDISMEDGYDVCKILGITTSFFWEQIDKRRDDFWVCLEPYTWTNELIKYLETQGRVVLLTSPSMSPDCVKGKTIWIQRTLGAEFRNYIMCPAPLKHLLATDNTILIDDSQSNCDMFENAGGKAILFPQPWNPALDDYHKLQTQEKIEIVEYIERILSNVISNNS